MDSFPDQEVRDLAVEAMQVGLHGMHAFVGDLSKAVDQEQRNPGPEKTATILFNHMKQAALGQELGPTSTPLFPSARILPEGAVPKDRYDPESVRWRSTVDPSAVHRGYVSGSINDLTYTPKLLSDHLTAAMIRDTLAHIFRLHGVGVKAYAADIPACFRLLRLHQSPLRLFTFRVVSEEHGTQFFTDLCCPFGWTASEWGWQCTLAMIAWRFRQGGFPDLMKYVDNFYVFSHPAMGQDFEARRAKLEELFAALGIPLHVRNEDPHVFKALGWCWELAGGCPVMVCAEDKFVFICVKLKEWRSAPKLLVVELESMVGILRWLSAGFRIGRAHLGWLVRELARFKGMANNLSEEKARYMKYSLSGEAKEALFFWARFFPRWSKRCEVFLDFGPCASWEVLGRVDASTDWGCGGFMWIRGAEEMFFFSHEWTVEERVRAGKGVLVRESTSVLEAIGMELWMRWFGRVSEGKRVLLEGDNEAVATGLRKAYSQKPEIMLCVHGVCESAARHNICLRTRAVLGARFNRVADRLSHNLVEEARCIAQEVFGCSMVRMR